jgi:hypothetical protein
LRCSTPACPTVTLTTEDLEPAGQLRLYQALVTKHFVLVRGGDARFVNITDARLAVAPT